MLGLFVVLQLACATSGGSQSARPEMALRRGSAWTTYSIDLPRVFGPTAELRLENGVLRGMIGSRPVDVTISGDEANGFSPGGPANLKMAEHDGAIEVTGLWNGGPVRMIFGATFARGSVIVARNRTGARELSCGYQLDRTDSAGALLGSSSCMAMPQQTRLELPPGIRNMLSPAELAVLLVAALGTPPFAPAERI
jgi:hypothetical protein